MKLYIARATCSRAVQLVANEVSLNPELVHVDVRSGTTSVDDDFKLINPLGYVPALTLDDRWQTKLTETSVILSYIADIYPEHHLIPPRASRERLLYDQLMAFVSTEIATRHVMLMRGFLSSDGARWTTKRLQGAYHILDRRLNDGRSYICGERLTIADALVWATMWHQRSGLEVGDMRNVLDLYERVGHRKSALRALADEGALSDMHRANLSAD